MVHKNSTTLAIQTFNVVTEKLSACQHNISSRLFSTPQPSVQDCEVIQLFFSHSSFDLHRLFLKKRHISVNICSCAFTISIVQDFIYNVAVFIKTLFVTSCEKTQSFHCTKDHISFFKVFKKR